MELSVVVLLSCLWQLSQALCVLEVGVGNLGMSVNCRFKKSSIVRVRNLGGIKGYVDVGLSLGDEMGFTPTFSQTEDRRRSSPAKRGSNATQQASGTRLYADPAGVSRLLEKSSRLLEKSSSRTAGRGSSSGGSGATKAAATSQSFRSMLRAATDHFQNLEALPDGGGGGRVWVRKAPRDYYPLGYPELPDHAAAALSQQHSAPQRSGFRCDRQRHLPGLYADQQIGCRVFHACVDSPKGSVAARSYSCPLYTLFDQTVLRCNWWFYVDCKAAHKLYDSNAPVAKTYHVVKALFLPAENEA